MPIIVCCTLLRGLLKQHKWHTYTECDAEVNAGPARVGTAAVTTVVVTRNT